MADWFEYRYDLDPLNPNDAGLDGDLDDLTNLGEYRNGTDPTNPDTDGDGLSDGTEVSIGTNPTNPDTDGDGMPDGWEVEYGLDPLFDDAYEDLDQDGITNIGEYKGGTNPAVDDVDGDVDGDGLTNYEEFMSSFNDIDGDLLPDRWEVRYGLNPLVSDVIYVDAQGDNIYPDSDGDGLDLMKELIYGTNPALSDTDGDGTNDGIEVAQGSYPADPSDGGAAPSLNEICELRLTVGDDSGSHSERYNLKVGPVTHQARQFGVVESGNYNQFRAGNRYEVRIIWQGCNKIGVNCGFPDYDYEAYIEAVSLPAGVIMQIENPEGILGEHLAYFDEENCTWRDPFYAKGKTAYVSLIKADITYADVTEDKIHINLEPSGLTGTLKLELTGPGASHTIREVVRSSGSYDETFDIPNLAIGEYTKVKATWTVDGKASFDEYNYHIQVLGVYRHSRYNLSNEACHSGPTKSFCYTTGNCTITSCTWHTDGSAKSDFLSDLVIQGSGYSSTLGYVTREGWCQNNGYPPPGGCEGHLLRDLSIANGCPRCAGQPLQANETVAINPDHPILKCGDKVFVHTVGARTVTDYGYEVVEQQLDHFIGLADCNPVTDIGNLMTIKLFD